MHLTDLYRLEAEGLQKVREHYRLLTSRADASAHNSPDALAKAAFEQAWSADHEQLIRDFAAQHP
jgi:hypothetical protein